MATNLASSTRAIKTIDIASITVEEAAEDWVQKHPDVHMIRPGPATPAANGVRCSCDPEPHGDKPVAPVDWPSDFRVSLQVFPRKPIFDNHLRTKRGSCFLIACTTTDFRKTWTFLNHLDRPLIGWSIPSGPTLGDFLCGEAEGLGPNGGRLGLTGGLLGSRQEMVYRDWGLMMRLHFGSDVDRSRRAAIGRKSRGKRRTPVS